MSPSSTTGLPRARNSHYNSRFSKLVGLLSGGRPAARTSAPRGELDRHFSGRSSSLTVLVPSRAEDATVVRSTLWAAALQEYPSKRLVLLVDDAAREVDAEADDIWLLTQQIADELAVPRARFANAFIDFQQRIASSRDLTVDAVYELGRQYGWASGWLKEWADQEANSDDVDEYLVDRVVRRLAADLDRVRVSLNSAADSGRSPVESRMLDLYRRLMWTFDAELVTFERSQYDSMPRFANKATSLDTYLPIVGIGSDEGRRPSGTVLSAIRRRQSSDLVYPDATYILELDPRSILPPEYALRLVHELEQPGNERIAVTQTAQSPSSTTTAKPARLTAAHTRRGPRRPRSGADGRWVA